PRGRMLKRSTVISPLYAITDSQLLPGERLYTAVTEALHGGCRRIQYRDKSSDSVQRTRQVDRLLKLCNDHGAQLLINDDLDLTLASGAHGVHLGQADAHPREARRRLGPDAIIGVTCHASLDLAQAAVRSGADYV